MHTAEKNVRHVTVTFQAGIKVVSAILNSYSAISLEVYRCLPATDSCTPEKKVPFPER